MSSPASIKNHPIHPILVGLPIGLWIFGLVSDIVFSAGGAPVWSTVAFCSIAGGIVGALLAAVPGFIDYLSIDEAEMKHLATYHLLINLGAVVLFAINLWSRLRLPITSHVPLVLSIFGVAAIVVSGWFGGEMVYVKGMAVQSVEELSKKQQSVHRTPRRAA